MIEIDPLWSLWAEYAPYFHVDTEDASDGAVFNAIWFGNWND